MPAAFVQDLDNAANSPGTSIAVTLASAVGAGNQISLRLAVQSGATVGTPTTNHSDTVVSRLGLTNFGGADCYIWTIASAVGGSTTFTVSVSSPAFADFWAREFSGATYDGIASNVQASGAGTGRTSGNATPTGSGLIDGHIFVDSGSSAVAADTGSGFTPDRTAGFSGNAVSEHKSYSSGAQAATFVNCGASSSIATEVLWKDGASNPALGSQTATFSQGTFSASNNSPTPPVRSAALAPLIGNKALGPLGIGGFALKRTVQVQAQANTVSLGSQTATFSQGTFTASSTGSAALGSQTATFSQGTFTANTSGGGSVGMGSQTATFSQGTFTASSTGGGTAAIGSQTATFTQGSMGIFTPAGSGQYFVRRHNKRRY